LNSVFRWQRGASAASTHNLRTNPGGLTLIAGPWTDQFEKINTAPSVSYPLRGDFEVQVKLVFTPKVCCQRAGIGIRSQQDQFTWLRITMREELALEIVENRKGNITILKDIPYADHTVYYTIRRQGDRFNISYSRTSVSWITERYTVPMPVDVEIFLVAFSAQNGSSVAAQFYEFRVGNG
jgi:regulation of enolase protein 1 (concanavalin A-like superfamily)